MSLKEEDYWPESLVTELKTLVRKERFDFNIVSSKLKEFWRDKVGGDSLDDIDISPKTCREAFARDYSKAPYVLDRMKTTKPVKVVTPPSSESTKANVETTARARGPQYM